MAFNFSGKKVLVTGATKGVGRQCAKSLAKYGAEVYALGRNEEELASLVQECGDKVHPLRVDLADWEATRAAVMKLPTMNGLVNNAGICWKRILSLDATKKEIDETFAVNLYAAMNVTQIIGKKMVEAGNGGSIVNVSSINGLNPQKDCCAYNMSKAAMDMMTKQFALELGPKNIRVNSVNPTVMITEMTQGYWGNSEEGRRLIAHTPLGRFAEVQECVNHIVYLLSDYSSMITGTMNPIEGGLLSNISV